MRGWKANEHVDFDFQDAHDLDSMTSRAQGEAYVKAKLKERMKKSSAALVLVGENTKNLYKFVRWELELAQELDLPIVVANLNEKTSQDSNLCPPIIRDRCAVHIPFKLKAIKFALDNWPDQYRRFTASEKGEGARYYNSHVYTNLGL